MHPPYYFNARSSKELLDHTSYTMQNWHLISASSGQSAFMSKDITFARVAELVDALD